VGSAQQEAVPFGQPGDLPGREDAVALGVVGDALGLGAGRREELLRLRAPERVGDQLPIVFAERE